MMTKQYRADNSEMNVPAMLYGTAWKLESTDHLVFEAVNHGFRAFDTANQAKHYNEEGVGKAIARAISEGIVQRGDLFLQSKYTHAHGHDQRLPYNLHSDYRSQLKQSLQGSLDHLGTDRIDSYLLHAPYQKNGLTAADWEVWRAMEEAQQQGKVSLLGVCNISIDQLFELKANAPDTVAFVQNRCAAANTWDAEVREFCQKNNIKYQGFSLLPASRFELNCPEIINIQSRYSKTIAQIVLRFATQIGIIPLTGSSNPQHVRENFNIFDFQLREEDIQLILNIANRGKAALTREDI